MIINIPDDLIGAIVEMSRKDDELMAAYIGAKDTLSRELAWNEMSKTRFSMAVPMFALAAVIKGHMAIKEVA